MRSHSLFLLAAAITAIAADDGIQFHHPRHHKHHGNHFSILPGPQLQKHHYYEPLPLGSHDSDRTEKLEPLQPLANSRMRVIIPVPESNLLNEWLYKEDDTYPKTPWLDGERTVIEEGDEKPVREKFENIIRIHDDTIDTTTVGAEEKADFSRWKPARAKPGEELLLY